MERYFELHNPKFQTTLNSAAFDASDWRFFDSRYAPSGCARSDAVTLSFLFILNFCIDRPFGFSAYQDDFLFNVSNFCLDRPFGFSVHRDAHSCLSRPFRFSTYRAVLIIFRQSIS
jgi:hypothetical protein